MLDKSVFLKKLNAREASIGIVGLGYVGLPLAVALSRRFNVVGYDISEERVKLLKAHRDPSQELSEAELAEVSINYTSDPTALGETPLIIVAVPTPIDENKNPDLSPLRGASQSIGSHLSKGSVVVFESTVYPGVTEEVCGPELEKASGLRVGEDFFLAYSPERINPGDRERTIDKIVKIVSGQTPEVADIVAEVYGAIVTEGIHRASSIRVAEAAKVIENAQRDINIAFVNELAIIFDKMGIDTSEVLEAAGTKWNFLRFRPGLVGGHCIGVDPYYLTFKAQMLGHSPQTILSGRRINDGMGRWIGRNLVKMLIDADVHVKGARVLIGGLTFKENVSDVRNSRVKDIIDELHDYHVDVVAYDPHVPSEVALEEFGVRTVSRSELKDFDAVVFAVSHDEFGGLDASALAAMMKRQPAPLIDLKWLFDRREMEQAGFLYWRL
uniref:Nucleotide sugar dehydrogenase n=1 Tax=uncultured bacterium 14-4D TaxID=1497525 RepID=A0A059U0F6_9BACT|nr:nucleotide sugar dehydrogenase [uncultured bacterium 14-4D]